jgi:hypothetical protein
VSAFLHRLALTGTEYCTWLPEERSNFEIAASLEPCAANHCAPTRRAPPSCVRKLPVPTADADGLRMVKRKANKSHQAVNLIIDQSHNLEGNVHTLYEGYRSLLRALDPAVMVRMCFFGSGLTVHEQMAPLEALQSVQGFISEGRVQVHQAIREVLKAASHDRTPNQRLVIFCSGPDADAWWWPDVRFASGLEWVDAGAEMRMHAANELRHEGLSAALQCKTEFTQNEWTEFGIADLCTDHVVAVGQRYMRPAEQDARHTREMLDVWRRQGASGRAWTSIGSERPDGEEVTSATLDRLLRKKTTLTATEWDVVASEQVEAFRLRTNHYVRIKTDDGNVEYFSPADGNRVFYVGVNSASYLSDAGSLGLEPFVPEPDFGCMWRSVETTRPPTRGRELDSVQLASALREKTEFTIDEWSCIVANIGRAQGPFRLRPDHFVVVRNGRRKEFFVPIHDPHRLRKPESCVQYDANVSRFTTDREYRKHGDFFASLIRDVTHTPCSNRKSARP